MIMQHYSEIRQLIARVRMRWLAVSAFHATVRAALAAAAIVGVAIILARGLEGRPIALVALAAFAVALVLAAIAWGCWPLHQVPTDKQVARFIEERAPSLDDRLVTAVDVASAGSAPTPGFAEPMLADAARRARAIDPDTIVPSGTLRRVGLQAAVAALTLAAVLLLSRGPARQAVDAASLAMFPGRVALEVTPGNARIKAGSTLAIHARLVGNSAPVIAQVQIANGESWRLVEMSTERPGAFRMTMDAVNASFKYRVVAGSITSPIYAVAVAHAPRVTRIDVDYRYPAGLGQAPRTERDSGDIYAPSGTDVRVHVFTDRPAVNGQLDLGNGTRISLRVDTPTELSGSLKVVDDNSYRVALADREGMANPGDTEYFIRTLEDRPPDVRILKPASDRQVTPLEEVDIEAQAEDDYGVDRLDLVYAVRGGSENVVPLDIPRHSAFVKGRHTLFLEDLNVQPGDFISYYVRARDLTRGARPNEARSDIFFLEVKPYEQAFAIAQTQDGAGGAASGSIDDLVAAQKEVVVATWKLDRRAQGAKGARSEQDIRSVSRAEAELKTKVEQTSSTFRQSTMRDPRRRAQPQRGRGGPPQPPQPDPLKAGDTLPEEDEMTAVAAAMGQAVTTLDALKTAEALPPEMDALNRLLKAQAAVKRREITRQASGNGNGNTNRNVDVSSLFDKELQKAQQTNYETKANGEQRENANQSELDKIKELAQRQDELLKRQQELARGRDAMSEAELKRELEKLTREQSELRQKAEELAKQMAGQQSNQSGQPQSPEDGKQDGKKGQSGQQGQSGRGQQGGQQSQSGQSGESDASKRMRDVSEEMRNATSELRRQDPGQASARGSRALDALREIERQLQSARPDEQRRALGEMQLEARQLADAERQISSQLGKASQSEAGKDAVRRLAGEQERLAERTRKLQDALAQQAGTTGAAGARGANDAAKELERQRVSDRMQQAADAMRAATEDPKGGRGNTASRSSEDARAQAAPQQDLARALDKIADKLASSGGTGDGESRKLSEQRARAQELKDKLNDTRRAIDRGGSGSELNRLREEYRRQLQETQSLVDQVRRDDPSLARGGGGFTFADPNPGTSVTAPGTEAFKQDFAKWEDLRRQATQALDNVESSLSKKLQDKQSRDRLAAGADDKAPDEYKTQVDSYFKAIAQKKP